MENQLTDADLSNLRALLSFIPEGSLNDQWQIERDDLYHRLGTMRNVMQSAPCRCELRDYCPHCDLP